MKNLAAQLGIQSYCFRGFKTLGEVLPRLKACGVSTVELSGVHGDFTREAATLLAQCRSAGVSIASIGVERFTGNLGRERALAEFMRQAGATVIAVDFAPDAGPGVWRAAEQSPRSSICASRSITTADAIGSAIPRCSRTCLAKRRRGLASASTRLGRSMPMKIP